MKRFYVIGVALVAVLAFSALAAASASATFLLAEWLLNGVAIAPGAEDLVEIEGEVTLEDREGVPVIGNAAVKCSGIFVGTVSSNSQDLITEVLSLTHTAPPLKCPRVLGCEASTLEPEVSPVNLPWETEAELFEQTGTTIFVDLIMKAGQKIGWIVKNCLVLGLPQTDECTTPKNGGEAGGAGISELTLEGALPLGVFSLAVTELTGTPLALCTASNLESGVVAGSGQFVISGGGELAASSDTLVQ